MGEEEIWGTRYAVLQNDATNNMDGVCEPRGSLKENRIKKARILKEKGIVKII